MSNIYDKLLAVQSKLKAPKSQTNTFGKYKYRSCEDILEAVKPLLRDEGLLLTMSDDIVEVGGRVYVRAIARIENEEQSHSVTAFARESAEKKGMDESQITGAASSYARKYALNGLFCIDDTKDADATNDHGKGADKANPPIVIQDLATPAQLAKITELIDLTNTNAEAMWKHYNTTPETVIEKQAAEIIKTLTKKLDFPAQS